MTEEENVPNEETLRAIEELESGNNMMRFSTVEEMMEELNGD